MHKARKTITSSENSLIDGLVHLDKFVVSGQEQDKNSKRQSY